MPEDAHCAASIAGTTAVQATPLECVPTAHALAVAQLHSPEFSATLLSSSAHGKTFEAALDELDDRFKGNAGSRAASIKAYLVYLRHRLQVMCPTVAR